jgi:hypothetical protein
VATVLLQIPPMITVIHKEEAVVEINATCISSFHAFIAAIRARMAWIAGRS